MIRIYNAHTSEKDLTYALWDFPQDIFHNGPRGYGDYWIEWMFGDLEKNKP